MKKYNRRSTLNNAAILAILAIIAAGRICIVSPEGLRIAGTAVALEVALLTAAYFIATVLNIRLLVPQLLLRNRFAAYTLALLGFVVIFIAIELFFERLLIDRYRLLPGKDWYLSDNGIPVFELLSSLTVYSISIAGTAIIIFRRLWNRSGAKMRDLEEQSARNKLEKVRTQIDAEALFDTLGKAANTVRRSPTEVSGMLMQLSKSLRTQLYESERKRHTAPQEQPPQTFNLSSPALDFLTEKRFRAWRHLAMITGFMFVMTGNIDGTWSSVLVTFPLTLLIYLILIYFNIYVLMPKLMMRNKTGIYLTAIVLSGLVIVMPAQIVHFLNIDANGHTSAWMLTLYTITNIIKINFPVISVNVILLFQYWVRNERRIAELETATLLSELEQLQNQVNPHFLFNMLNNIIVLTKKNPDEAADVLHKLNDMLKYQFRGFEKQLIRLGDDVRFLTDYLNLEKLRRDNFEFSIATDGGAEEIALPPLLFIPFVENAVKHNNDNRNLSFVRLRFALENDTLCFDCVNSKPLRPMRRDEIGGLGLPNVRRRLDLLYGKNSHLEISENETLYTVRLIIKLKK